MKSFNTVVSASVILLSLGSSVWLWNQAATEDCGTRSQTTTRPSLLQEQRDLQSCSSNATCSCALSLSNVTNVTNDGCSYDLTSQCSVTCPGVCNGTDLRIESVAICPDGACEIAATCDNGRGCIGPCNTLATTVEEYCTPVDCSSSQSIGGSSFWRKSDGLSNL